MNSVYLGNITITIFGESHEKAIGVVIDGLPPGLRLDLKAIEEEMERRKPGSNSLTTMRKEEDQISIISGIFEGCTTGTPMSCLIFNEDTKSKDYSELKVKMRPGHSDYPGKIHFRGFNDYRGGGHFSGRLTAPLVFAGAVAKEYLKEYGVVIGSHFKKIYDTIDDSFKDETKEDLKALRKMKIPVLKEGIAFKIEEAIITAKKEQNSVGGEIECMALGVKAGLGSPLFNSLESKISSLVFSVPGVKGISFGLGFGFGDLKGSEANDSYYMSGNKVKVKSNNNGGIIGGLSLGSPIVFKVIMKPTPSISKKQNTVNIETMKDTELEILGRNDPCIALRGLPVIEAALAIALFDAYLEDKKWDYMTLE